MLSEEEKEIIKFLKTFVKTNIDYCKLEKNDVLAVLNLIEKQSKEIEEIKNQEATQRKINELLVQRYSNSISLQKIKDKIEEVKDGTYDAKIVLQSLLDYKKGE